MENRNMWLSGRIAEVGRSEDGLCRSVLVKTSKGGYLQRPPEKIFPLEIDPIPERNDFQGGRRSTLSNAAPLPRVRTGKPDGAPDVVRRCRSAHPRNGGEVLANPPESEANSMGPRNQHLRRARSGARRSDLRPRGEELADASHRKRVVPNPPKGPTDPPETPFPPRRSSEKEAPTYPSRERLGTKEAATSHSPLGLPPPRSNPDSGLGGGHVPASTRRSEPSGRTDPATGTKLEINKDNAQEGHTPANERHFGFWVDEEQSVYE